MSEVTSPHWYLVQARPGQAERAVEQLERQGYCVFDPRLRCERLRRGRPVVVEQALFPDYLFIRLQAGVDNFGPVRSTRGVRQLVGFGDVPVPFYAAFIETLRRELAAWHVAAPSGGREPATEASVGGGAVTLVTEGLEAATALTGRRVAASAGPPALDPGVENLLDLTDPRARIRALMGLVSQPRGRVCRVP